MIRVGILGYGNVGRGVRLAVSQQKDMALAAVFTRRDPASMGDPLFVSASELEAWQDRLDVLVLCGGSATDLPRQAPMAARLFNTVDSFDTHARIPGYFAAVDEAARGGGHVSLISGGWDPGLFSMLRVLGQAILPEGSDATFWGPGVSQGHSDAVRRIPGVADARQYTLPVESSVELARKGRAQGLTARQKHTRLCYVVAREGADRAEIERAIVTMPNYFADYDTTVHFIDQETMDREHSRMPHGGFVIRSGTSAGGSRQNVEFRLNLESNPEFTGSVLAACARAVVRMARRGCTGAMTMVDLPVAALSPMEKDELLSHWL